MAVVEELLRSESNGNISFGNHMLKQEVLECMPDCFDNPYVATSMKEFYQLLVQLLKCNVTENELIQIADNFKKM